MAEEAKEKKINSVNIKKILGIVEWVLIAILLVFDIFVITTRFTSRTNGDTFSFFGTQTRIVLTGSMEGSDSYYASHPEYEIKALPVNTAVFIQEKPKDQEKLDQFYASLKVGDVITFNYAGTKPVTHRIIKTINVEHDYTFVCSGDALIDNKSLPATQTLTVNAYGEAKSNMQIVGKVKGSSKFVGFLVVNIAYKKWVMFVFIILPCFLVSLYFILSAIFASRKEKREQMMLEKQNEVDRLKQELEELKTKQMEEEKHE